MSWSGWAATLIGAKPIWLYELFKDGEYTFYTTKHIPYSAVPSTMTLNFFAAPDLFSRINFFEETFLPQAISHTAIRATSNPSKKQVTFTLPRSDTFAQKFVGRLGIADTQMTAWQGFENDVAQEFPRMFRGEVKIVKPSWAHVALICEDAGGGLRNKAIAAVIQRPCRHALYHGLCTLDIASFNTAGSATAMASGVVTVSEASAQADGYYSGGIITYGTSLQFITGHTGTQLSVLGSVGDLESDIDASGTQVVSIAPGCNRTMAICAGTFSNGDNFGGFEFMTNSPFDGRSMT